MNTPKPYDTRKMPVTPKSHYFKLVAAALMVIGVILAIGHFGSESIREAEAANGGPINMYIPTMEFLLIEDTDLPEVVLCKRSAYSTVEQFSYSARSGLVRNDKKLYSLGLITYNECLILAVNLASEWAQK